MPRTPWAVICPNHGQAFLSREQYNYQMDLPNALWFCPECGEVSNWDDDNELEHRQKEDQDGYT